MVIRTLLLYSALLPLPRQQSVASREATDESIRSHKTIVRNYHPDLSSQSALINPTIHTRPPDIGKNEKTAQSMPSSSHVRA